MSGAEDREEILSPQEMEAKGWTSSDSDLMVSDEPLSLSLMGKLFGVPLLIISTIVGGAVLVVLLFGAPAAPERRSVDDLVQVLESSSGEASLGILLPREKGLWQTALELSERLTTQKAAFTDEELTLLAERLGALVSRDLTTLDRLATIGQVRARQQEIRSSRLGFVIRALGRTERPEAVGPLIEVVRSGLEPYAGVAAEQLGALHSLPESRAAIGPIVALLGSSARVETRLIACTVLSVLAAPGDTDVIEALSRVRVTSDGEMAWSAALALARLGCHTGTSTILDLLDRSFWEKDARFEKKDESGAVRQYPMPPGRIEEFLLVAIDAGAMLPDARIGEALARLAEDESLQVRAKAAEAVRVRGTTANIP